MDCDESKRDIDAAKHAVVHEYPGGAVALAEKVDMRAATLSNKVNPSMSTHHLNVDEAVRVQRATGDHRLLHAEARALGYVCVPVGEAEGVCDTDLLDAWAEWHCDTGETADAIKRALADSVMERAELGAIRAEMFEDFGRELELLRRLRGLCPETHEPAAA